MQNGLFIDLQCSCHYFAFTFDHILLESVVSEEPLQYSAEDPLKSVTVKLGKTDQIDVSEYSGSDESLSSSGSSHGCYEDQINQLFEWLLFVFIIIPSSLVNHLSQYFNRWLGSPFFLFGHIQIIHKYHCLSCLWSEYSSSLLIYLAINDILSLSASSLCTEAHFNGLIDGFIQTIHQQIIDVG